MSAADRPWWATEEGATSDPAEDPVEAHRAARRGQVPPTEPGADDGPVADADPDAGEGGTPGAGAGDVDDGSWWVPATEAVTRLARDLRSVARADSHGDRVGGAGVGGDGAGGGGERGEGVPGEGSGGGGGEGSGHRIDACGVCPICVGLRAIGEARPDLVVHLAEAARQLALAVRMVVDVAVPDDEAAAGYGSDGDRARAGGRRAARRDDDLQRIDLDD